MDQSKVGSFLKELRLEKKFSQEDLAEQLHISRQAISKWENGRGIPDLETLQDLSSFYHITINEILAGRRFSDKEVEKESEKVTKEILKVQETQKKKIHRLGFLSILFFIIILFLFLLYYFLTFYNSFKIYRVVLAGEKFYDFSGLLIVTKEEIYFQLNNIQAKEGDTIQKVTLYYLENGDQRKIYTDTDTVLAYTPTYGGKNIFLIGTKEDRLKDLYLDVTYEGGIETIPLEITEIYTNNLLFSSNKDTFLRDLKKYEPLTRKMNCEEDYCTLFLEKENIMFSYQKETQTFYVDDFMKGYSWVYRKGDYLIFYHFQNQSEEPIYITDETDPLYQRFQKEYLEKYL